MSVDCKCFAYMAWKLLTIDDTVTSLYSLITVFDSIVIRIIYIVYIFKKHASNSSSDGERAVFVKHDLIK